jgi:agmatine deiminase
MLLLKMIADYQTNTVYLADSLDEQELRKFKSFLESQSIIVKIINGTKDYYCRDYMPIQVDETAFVQFVFKPNYFKPKDYKYITNTAAVHLTNDFFKFRYSNIILDGGNVVKWKDKVIISDKVYLDNHVQFGGDEDAIKAQLEKELKCKVIIVPAYPDDDTGHADGMVRFIDRSAVFINEDSDKDWLDSLEPVIIENNLKAIPIPCTMLEGQKTGDGLYINYLQVGNLVVVPQFGSGHADEAALKILNENLGETNKVVPYNAKKIAENGGILNCATWSIKVA